MSHVLEEHVCDIYDPAKQKNDGCEKKWENVITRHYGNSVCTSLYKYKSLSYISKFASRAISLIGYVMC